MERNAPERHQQGEWQRILDDEVASRLDRPVAGHARNGTRNYQAYATCHEDAKRSLTVSVGDFKPVVWYCHSCVRVYGEDVAERRARRAMLDRGVPAWALKLSAGGTGDLEDRLRALLKSGLTGSQFRLHVAALVESYDDLPSGTELEVLADMAQVSHATAYRAPRIA